MPALSAAPRSSLWEGKEGVERVAMEGRLRATQAPDTRAMQETLDNDSDPHRQNQQPGAHP